MKTNAYLYSDGIIIRTKGLIMKTITICVLGLFLVGCSSTKNEVDYSKNLFPNDINTPYKKRNTETNNVAVAAAGIALATVVGAINKNNFECEKECEQALKKAIANRTKKKEL